MGQLLIGLGGCGIFVWLAARSVRQAASKGRQRTTYLLSRLTFFAFLATFSAQVGYYGIGSQDDAIAHGLAQASAILLVLSVLAYLLAVVVDWYGKPMFLIPQAHRHEPPLRDTHVSARKRKQQGLPPTDHLVEIYHMIPEAGTADSEGAYYVGLCESCDWMEFADTNVTGPNEEAQLREKAARHTTNVARELVRREY